MRKQMILIAVISVVAICHSAMAGVERIKEQNDSGYIIVEVLDDDLIHVELSAMGSGPDTTMPLYTSPMVDKLDYTGPSEYNVRGGELETAEMSVLIDPVSLCITVADKKRHFPISAICPVNLMQPWKGLTLSKENFENVYGLGQQFRRLGTADGDWVKHGVREAQPAGQQQCCGNGFMPFGGAGMVGNVQFPVMYAVGRGTQNYALFLDNVYQQGWAFNDDPWRVEMFGDHIRFYIMTGPDLADLRSDYLELTGRPPVPPRKAFGLWVSEFGYENWQQILLLKNELRADGFPVDGFVLDLQWFGGVLKESPDSPMGRLDWDRDPDDGNGFYFPDPAQNIAGLADDHIGLIAIEESYINRSTQTFASMKSAGDLLAYAKNNGRCDPDQQDGTVILPDTWFGRAGMVDWSDTRAGNWIHDHRRFPNLVRNGISGHWTDLGEPEKYDPDACYDGVETVGTQRKNRHPDIHNLYNFLWNRSIYNGYVRYADEMNGRPFILSRSGAPGSQRFGAAFWSGDIGSSLDLLATHLNAQMHMTFSGVDYYGSDIGGFRREAMPYNSGHSGNLQYQEELYTQWLANGAWFDIPIRPHTDNSFQTNMRYETSPNRVGRKEANLANLRQRYELLPYYYSLAYRAHLYGEPVIAPLVFHYQNDPEARQMGHEKLIGRDILAGVVARHGEFERNIYLPEGKWINYHTHEWVRASEAWVPSFPVYLDGILRLPVFVRAGAILPKMYVDEQTKDVFNHRKDGSARDELILEIYPDENETEFMLYEDDGLTLAYDDRKKPVYQYRTTGISQEKVGDEVRVTIRSAEGDYPGAVNLRINRVRMITEYAEVLSVTLDGVQLTRYETENTYNAASSGWFPAGHNLIEAKSPEMDVHVEKRFLFTLRPLTPTTSVHFVCDNGWTNIGETIHVVGNVPELGNWDVDRSVELDPSIYHAYIYDPPPNHHGPGPNTPKWTGLVQGLPVGGTIEWKCVKRRPSGQWEWEPGGNNVVTTTDVGFAGTSVGAF